MRFAEVAPLLPATAPAVRRALGGKPKAVAHYLAGAARDGRLVIIGEQPERVHNHWLTCHIYALNPDRAERGALVNRDVSASARRLADIPWLAGARTQQAADR
jgi:hypothetical protein